MSTQTLAIDIEPTPNPDVMKFLPRRSVSGGRIVDYPSKQDHVDESPLAARLFAVEGVQGVMLGADFISVTRKAGASWPELKPPLQGAIIAHYHSGDPVLHPHAGRDETAEPSVESDEISQKIQELLELRVRPAVSMDGGDIQFHGFDKGVVYVTLRGACAGCPSATVTLKMGIENMLRHYIPEVTEVRTVA